MRSRLTQMYIYHSQNTRRVRFIYIDEMLLRRKKATAQTVDVTRDNKTNQRVFVTLEFWFTRYFCCCCCTCVYPNEYYHIKTFPEY